jgi:hypothetical protein
MHRNSEIHPESSGLAYTERLLSVHEKRTIGEAKVSMRAYLYAHDIRFPPLDLFLSRLRSR